MKNAESILEQLLKTEYNNATQIRKISEFDLSTINTNNSISENNRLLLEITESIVDDNISSLINKILDYSSLKLAFSDVISDVLIVFKNVTELIGKIEFIFAILFSVIYDEKRWINYGFPSLDSFLDSLPNVYRISRQTFINIAISGKMIRFFGCWSFVKDSFGNSFKLTPLLFHRNYSKLKFLYRIQFIWKLDITYEIMINFRDMTYRDFSVFVKNYKELNKHRIIIRIRRKSFLSKENLNFYKFSHSRPFKVNTLEKLELEIYKEIRLGRLVRYIYSTNSIFIDSVINYLHEIYNKEYKHIHNLDNDYKYPIYFSSTEIFYEGQPEIPLCDVDWANYVPDNLSLTVENIGNIAIDLMPNELRKVIIDKLQNKVELTLVQAYLIYLIEHNTKLHFTIYDYFKKYNIPHQYTLEQDFATNILNLKLSRYKWLKRIGNSIPYLNQLNNVFDFTGNFLDKLSYLKTAFDNHKEEHQLITEAFIMSSTKRFRKFACDKNDKLSHDLINRSDYQKAKPILNEVRICQRGRLPITVITLQSQKQIELLDDINLAIKTKEKNIIKDYPEINWASILNIKEIFDTSYDDKLNELKHLGLAALFHPEVCAIKKQLEEKIKLEAKEKLESS
jgi:hypothetical protein